MELESSSSASTSASNEHPNLNQDVAACIVPLGNQIKENLKVDEQAAGGEEKCRVDPGLLELLDGSVTDFAKLSIAMTVPDSDLDAAIAEEFAKTGIDVHDDLESAEGVKNFAKAMQVHPIPTQMAFAYIRNVLLHSDHPVKAYLELFEREICSVDEQLFEMEKAAFKAWNLTLKIIQEDPEIGLIATQLIYMASFFDSTNIPLGIFANLQTFSNSNKLAGSVELLKTYGVLSGTMDIINVDPLIQRVILLGLPIRQCREILNTIIKLIQPQLSIKAQNQELTKSLLPHAETVWRHAVKHQSLVSKFVEFPCLLTGMQSKYGRHAEMLQLARDAWAISIQTKRKNK